MSRKYLRPSKQTKPKGIFFQNKKEVKRRIKDFVETSKVDTAFILDHLSWVKYLLGVKVPPILSKKTLEEIEEVQQLFIELNDWIGRITIRLWGKALREKLEEMNDDFKEDEKV